MEAHGVGMGLSKLLSSARMWMTGRAVALGNTALETRGEFLVLGYPRGRDYYERACTALFFHTLARR